MILTSSMPAWAVSAPHQNIILLNNKARNILLLLIPQGAARSLHINCMVIPDKAPSLYQGEIELSLIFLLLWKIWMRLC
jgi:hypothetical protein